MIDPSIACTIGLMTLFGGTLIFIFYKIIKNRKKFVDGKGCPITDEDYINEQIAEAEKYPICS